MRLIRESRDRYRTELTDSAILSAIGPVTGLDVLDAGCGEGYLSRILASSGARTVGVDVCDELIEAAQALNAGAAGDAGSAVFRVADVAALPLASATIDLVVANHLVNDLRDPAPAFREFARILRPGGRLVNLQLHPCFYDGRTTSTSALDYFDTQNHGQWRCSHSSIRERRQAASARLTSAARG